MFTLLVLFFLMLRRPPRSTRTDTLFPYTTLFRSGVDAVLVTPPVFGMYAVCARLQRAPLVEVPLRDGDEDFSIDLAAVAELAQRKSARLVFLCSPGNPAGRSEERRVGTGCVRTCGSRWYR